MSTFSAQLFGSGPTNIVDPKDFSQRLLYGMTRAQAAAFTTLARGGTVTLAAARAGVTRVTVYRWLKSGGVFHQRLQLCKSGLAATLRTRLLQRAQEATDAIQDALLRGHSRAALKIVARLGVLAPPPADPAQPAQEPLPAPNPPLENPTRQRVTAVRSATRTFHPAWDSGESET